MTSAPADNTPLPLTNAVETALRQVREVHVPARVELPLVETDLLQWLEAQILLPRVYWRSRDSEFELAGIGIADKLSSAEAPQIALPALRYVGGQRFDPEYPRGSSDWEPFGGCRFICPLIEIRRAGNTYQLAVNILRENLLEPAVRHLQDMSLVTPEFTSSTPAVVSQQSQLKRTEFTLAVTEASVMIADGQLSKVALARALRLDFEEEVSPWWLLAKWRESSDHCYLFGLQAIDGDAFVSTTPERLYERRGRSIKTEAVAGTRPRGTLPEDDERLGQELLDSDKDRREHRWVQEAIAESLHDLTEGLTFTPTGILRLPRLQHLVSTAEGMLRPEVSDRQILDLLPPTPAVAGYPRDRAIGAIRQWESFDRGWYAGPIGWLGDDGAELAVGIRSCLIRERQLTAYAGVGIVEGSIPDLEWRETEQKLASFIGQVVAI